MKKLLLFIVFIFMCNAASSGLTLEGLESGSPKQTVNPLIEKGIRFDGVDDYMLGNTNSDYNFSDDFSFSFWAYAYSSGNGAYGRIAQMYESTPYHGWSWYVGEDVAGDQWIMNIGDANGDFKYVQSSAGGFDASTPQWYHIVLTFDYSNSEYILYINGAVDNDSDALGSPSSTTENFMIGNRATLDRAWDGYIVELTIWTGSGAMLSSDEVKTLYNGRGFKDLPLTIKPSLIVGYWDLQELDVGDNGDGETFTDSVGNDTVVGEYTTAGLDCNKISVGKTP